MDVFWPETSQEVAQNRLHVALHALRQDLRSVTDEPIVVHVHGSFGISREVDVWLDVEEFRRRVAEAREFEVTGQCGRMVEYSSDG